MAVMISEDKKDLVVTCRCGCEEGVHITISHEDGEDYYAYQCFMNGNFYKDRCGMFATLKNKLNKIWAIIRNKDYYYYDVVMTKKDFEEFKKFVNQY